MKKTIFGTNKLPGNDDDQLMNLNVCFLIFGSHWNYIGIIEHPNEKNIFGFILQLSQ